ncbi:MAG: alkaline phosphatase family protein, partial [Vicinamibacteria bacterium]
MRFWAACTAGIKNPLTFLVFFSSMTSIGCSDRPSLPLSELISNGNPSGVKIVLVGIDGATLSVIEPMMREGSLPEFQSLIEGGVQGALRSEHPMRSPAIWTTIVTGRSRDAHGIDNFTTRRWPSFRKVLVNSDHRKVLALWNLLGPFQKSAGFVGWWASWPGEPVSGWIVSDRLAQSAWSAWVDGTKEERVT